MSDLNYFRFIPDFEYITRGPDKGDSFDYTKVKNFFVRGIIRNDLYNEITLFDRYIIEGDDRPDTVANKLYEDPNLDWVILLTNNILNVYSEWPLSEIDLNNYIIDKYGSYSKAYEVRYYETLEIKSQDGTVLVPAGLKVSSQYIDFNETILVYQGTDTFDPITDEEILEEVEVPNPNYLQLVPTFFTYFDSESGKDVTYNQVIKEVSNYEYEVKLNEEKRQIFALKKEYLNVILDQIEENLAYKKGSKQFVSESLKRGSTVEFED